MIGLHVALSYPMSLKHTLLTLTAGLLLIGCGEARQSDRNTDKEDVVAGTYVCEVGCQSGGTITYYSCAYSSVQAKTDGENMCDSEQGTQIFPQCEPTGQTCYLDLPDYAVDAGEYDVDASEDFDIDGSIGDVDASEDDFDFGDADASVDADADDYDMSDDAGV